MFPVTNPTKIQMKQVNMMASVLDEIQLGWDIAYYQYSSTTPKGNKLDNVINKKSKRFVYL
jgi:D-lyxose ketol-isomerase